jgi:hypothetical protein
MISSKAAFKIPGIEVLYLLLVRLVGKGVLWGLRAGRQDIGLARELISLYETARFVDREMGRLPSSATAEELLKESIATVKVPGLYLEFGVFQGKFLNLISAETPEIVYGFDSFEGLPEFWRDDYPRGAFGISGLPQVRANARLVKGWFSESLPPFLREHSEKFAFVHVDCDLYSSTVSIFTLAEGRFQEGTVIVFDEFFNYPGWQEGEYRAFVEFIARTKFTFEYLGWCRTHEQVAVRLGNRA